MDRCAIHDLITERYRDAHGASPAINYPVLRGLPGLGEGQRGAALGYRRADAGALYLETYLDIPVERALGTLFGRELLRSDIVEIGNLASDTAPAMIALWMLTANDLGGTADVAVAVLTAPLRAMFRRLGLTLHEIAPARSERIADASVQWGRYYQQDPVICAGSIPEGQARLAQFAARRQRTCA